ncbi:DUF1273 domain-containing protein [Lacticaseibacillus pantheris]|uniref:DUF1273 domain-containing protein n=1 Tax=Lacticaseibacillus pantheris TaxID=171523 RepID=UPI002659B7F1|nr:DUF1273 domain-containing protein [Lacticaseibacillus pantheris]WKF84379.1 DUF1273 domain-containing protein [Lacticaseibacillus pantheris]
MRERVWVTGYRAYELSVFNDNDPKVTVIKYYLKSQLTQLLDEGLEWIITGGQPGVEQWSAEVGLELQADFPQLRVAVMVPFTDFGGRWKEERQAQLAALRARVDFTASVSTTPYTSPRQLVAYGDFMSTHTDLALMVYDPEFPGKAQYDYERISRLAARSDYSVRMTTMDDLQEAANEYGELQNDRSQNE